MLLVLVEILEKAKPFFSARVKASTKFPGGPSRDGYQAVFMISIKRLRSSWRVACSPGLAQNEMTCASMQSMSDSVEFPSEKELLS